ncbi:hypothetical protein [Burkholderia anthina]|uniref:hypothetical protein n=1 Tax=Burkholderia anthina TaxID=179879 RepID=UPI00158A0F82|nr:hypothetical protein [Burkholderia anthina]
MHATSIGRTVERIPVDRFMSDATDAAVAASSGVASVTPPFDEPHAETHMPRRYDRRALLRPCHPHAMKTSAFLGLSRGVHDSMNSARKRRKKCRLGKSRRLIRRQLVRISQPYFATRLAEYDATQRAEMLMKKERWRYEVTSESIP